MEVFQVGQLEKEREAARLAYLEFLRVADLSMGLYVLPAGGTDSQSPHSEDEVYYVVQGRAVMRVAARDYTVQPGSVVYVPKNVEHRFHSIEEPLQLLVFFASGGVNSQRAP
jgi:mannose-6-phosphate isomerase-like protein (cupin superfamily)